jgi:hypothetical protein
MRRVFRAVVGTRKAALASAILLYSGTAFAQSFRLGIDVASLIPVGDFGIVADSRLGGNGFGALLRLEVLTPAGFFLTARSGYIQHLTQMGDEPGLSARFREIPILVGARLYSHTGIYGALEAGATSVAFTATNTRISGSRSSSSLSASAVLGIGLLAGPVDFQLSLRSVDVSRVTNTLEFGFSVGFNALSL